MRRTVLSVIAVVAFGATACGNDAADTVVAVRGTDKTCVPAMTRVAAGKLRFDLTNDGKLATELYVLGKNDRVIAEVENVLPGNTESLHANLKAGTYTLACKPGQTGAGIRKRITVTGSGGAQGAAAAKADQRIDVDAHEYAFVIARTPTIKKGDAVEVHLMNGGNEQHEFEVLGPDDKPIGEIAEIAPGTDAKSTFEFASPGTYTYQCLVEAPDGATHKAKGMHGTFTVK